MKDLPATPQLGTEPAEVSAAFDSCALEKVRELEEHLAQMPQVELQTKHLVHGGMYARTILIPAGTVLTGALLKADNTCVMAGDITVTTSEGARRFTGFHVLPAEAGHKRAGFAHADTWWTAIVRTDLEDVFAIEESLTDEGHKLQSRRAGICAGEALNSIEGEKK